MKAANQMTYLQFMDHVAQRLLEWAREEESVLAWFWYGSFSVGKASSGSDLDAAVLFKAGTDLHSTQASIRAHLGELIIWELNATDAKCPRFVCYLGERLLKFECHLADAPEQLAWLADSNDVPAPRLVLGFQRDGAGEMLALRARRPCEVDVIAIVNQEIEKFMEAFEACSRQHSRSDAYGFYFHYNLALGRLARLVQISRHKAERLYLPPQLTNTRLALKERRPFWDLAGKLYLRDANATKRKLAQKFIEFVLEIQMQFPLRRSSEELRGFLNAVMARDFFWNVRDWADHLEGRVKRNVVVRASTLTRWQDEPELVQWMSRQGVRQIIDLRGDSAKDGAPYNPEILNGIDYVQQPFVNSAGISMDEADRSQYYIRLVKNNLPTVVGVFNALAKSTGMSVIHCYAGCDRTGVIMALLGNLLGIPRELLVKDYTASGVDMLDVSINGFLIDVETSSGTESLLSAAGLTKNTVNLLREKLLSTG